MAKNILLLQRDSDVPTGAIEALLASGSSVVSVKSAAMAEDLLKRYTAGFSMVLLDASASEDNANGLCTKLRGDGFPEPIVIFGGPPGEDALVSALEAGADDFLPLACDAREAFARIAARLRD